MLRVAVEPALIRWARERAAIAPADLARKSGLGKYPEWEAGRLQPTLKQVDKLANALHVPVGYLFLSSPPDEPLPIPDFRTVGSRPLKRPSVGLLDTIYACQERQAWYRDYARLAEEPPLSFVGSVSTETAPVDAAEAMRESLEFSLATRKRCSTWADALRMFIQKADDAGVLVMVNGVVGNNTNRRLDPAEFRGFAMPDPFAPLVFVNGADSKAAQMFTLAHELAHVWLGNEALSDGDILSRPDARREEIWCNAVAAELLVPLSALEDELGGEVSLPSDVERLARTFKVSSLVVLRRLHDVSWIDSGRLQSAWQEEHDRLIPSAGSGGGGNFYATAIARVGRRFARALVADYLEGQTLPTDTFHMLCVTKTATFDELARRVSEVR